MKRFSARRKGFTDLGEAKQFAEETKCDWLSVAVGSIHGAIAEGVRNQKKPEARLDIQHIADLSKVTNIPLVLHGGSGINNQCILDGIANGIAKINVGTEIRQTYERTLGETNDVEKARAAVYTRTCEIIRSSARRKPGKTVRINNRRNQPEKRNEPLPSASATAASCPAN